MSAANDKPENHRWPALFRHASQPIYVLNPRRRVIFVNDAWTKLTQVTAPESRSLTCTARRVGGDHGELAATLAPPEEVLGGRSVSVRRPAPGRETGPPWWDIDFLPILGEDRSLGVLARVAVVAGPMGGKVPMPSGWSDRRMAALARFRWSSWESSHPAMHRAVTQARLVAQTGCAAAIVGPRGVGKYTLARTIHAESDRRELNCLCLECDRLPPDSVSAAIRSAQQVGLVYLAEPAALPRDVQVELARSVPERQQVVVGMSSDPEAELHAGRLSAELWAAVSTVVIQLPTLRERRDDISRLVGRAANVSPEAMAAMGSADWPGNFDDLMRLVANTAGRTIELSDLPLPIRQPEQHGKRPRDWPALDTLLAEVEWRMIQLALARTGGNKQRAAELLQVWRPRLLKRIEARQSPPREGD